MANGAQKTEHSGAVPTTARRPLMSTEPEAPQRDLTYDVANMMRYGHAIRAFWNALRFGSDGMDRREATQVTIAMVAAQMSNPSLVNRK